MDNPDTQQPLVLITRALTQSEHFSRLCQREGFRTALLPCLEISAEAVDPADVTSAYEKVSYVVFTSVNAVKYAHSMAPLPWSDCSVFAIGAATAQALSNLGQPLFEAPLAPYNSENFLEQIQRCKPASLLIVKGVGGRELIQRSLQQSGWKVDSISLYRRDLPQPANNQISRLFELTPPDIVSVTSNEVLKNLWHLCTGYHHVLINLPLMVNSQRCANLAVELGFNNQILIATPAGDEGQVKILCKWKLTAM